MMVEMGNTASSHMQWVAAVLVTAGVFDWEPADITPGQPKSDAGRGVLASFAPVPRKRKIGAVVGRMLRPMPLPAFIRLPDLDKAPELKEPPTMRPVNSVNIQAESSFSQCADATDASM